MHTGAADFSWPVERLVEAIETLAQLSGLTSRASAGVAQTLRRESSRSDTLDGGVERLSRALEFEVESADVPHHAVQTTVENAGPALLKVTSEGGDNFLVLLGSSGKIARLLALDGRWYRVPVATVAGWLRAHLEEPIREEVDQLLEDSDVPRTRWDAARGALFGARLGPARATRCWILRPTPAASLWQHMRHTKLPRRLAVFIIAYAGAAVASISAWWLIGGAAIEGRFDAGTLLAWSFLLLSLVPLGLFAMWSQGVFVLGISGILKLQLLAGALKLDADETRHQGVGSHLARVIESGSLESLALAGGFYALTAFFDLLLAAAVLVSLSRIVELAVLLLFVALVWVIGAAYFRARQRWTAMRLHLTHDLVEQMVGHRTRLVQESSAKGHDHEDEALTQYLEVSRRMDRAGLLLTIVPRVWVLIGLAVLAPQFVTVESTTAMLAVGLGVMLLASTALVKMTSSLTALVDAAVSWKQVSPLLTALRRPDPLGHVDLAGDSVSRMRSPRTGPLITAQDLAFRFPDRADTVLSGCGFRITPGDRIHLSGPSGGGKSTLVSLLTGLRVPDSGLLLLDGLDRATLGTRAWRRRVAAAPQFHENHLFNDTLAFNLLMGRRWPPTADDLQWAETVCRRIGLGDVLDRMPSGLFQVVGETGWQLSHGERSRVYMARALLQGADLVVLDESFAELDPDSLQRCLPEAAELSKSLIVVAHA
jgi:ATP-binding cassette, subfamily B, bacterial